MKKSFLVVIILVFAVSLIHAKDMFSFSSKGNGIEIQFENSDESFSLGSENAFTTIALPSDDIEIIIHDFTLSEYSENGKFLKNVEEIESSRIKKITSFTMREIQGHTLQIKIQAYNENDCTYSKIEKVNF